MLPGLLMHCQQTNDLPLHSEESLTPSLKVLASKYYPEDTDWYVANVPFFECSDKKIEAVYYYRWRLYKAHLRNVGRNKFIVTEFINHVPWDREPWCTINAASMHHLYEGRWLRDDRYMNGYTHYLLAEGGNDRRYSESVPDAAYARYLVNGDATFLTDYLDSMKATYDNWQDHWDSLRGLYYIAAMPDATEYNIASIDASGGKAGFDGGVAFRPTINSYMFGNARAIARIAAMKGDTTTANTYHQRASRLKDHVQKFLWNPSLQHFTDRFKEQNQFVNNWDFIRGRELAGMAPWYFNLPDDDLKYAIAWRHVADTTHLLGRYGLRTNEPAYEHYFKQFVFFQGKRGSQWNGPSWPYQTSQTITALANFLNAYQQDVVTASDYVHLLRQYSNQHYLPDGSINLVENYDPNLGGPIVYYYWSNHYNHSTFNNLIITGLCGLRPAAGDSLVVNPLIDDSIDYFRLENVSYHGHDLTVVFDRDGKHYNLGTGLIFFVDGRETLSRKAARGSVVYIGNVVARSPGESEQNHALNISKKGFPRPTSSLKLRSDSSLYQAIDGRIWYFREISNYWATKRDSATDRGSTTDWYALDFGQQRPLSKVKLYFIVDQRKFALPDSVAIEYNDRGMWKRARLKKSMAPLIPNTGNTISFDSVSSRQIRILFHHSAFDAAVSEIECY